MCMVYCLLVVGLFVDVASWWLVLCLPMVPVYLCCVVVLRALKRLLRCCGGFGLGLCVVYVVVVWVVAIGGLLVVWI